MKKLLALLPILILSTGCANYGRLSKNLANDGAIVVANIGTPWGTQKLIRIGGTTNSVSVAPDGTVTINPPNVEQPKAVKNIPIESLSFNELRGYINWLRDVNSVKFDGTNIISSEKSILPVMHGNIDISKP